MTCGIYLIANKEARIYYIGQSSSIETRWRAHKGLLRGTKKGRLNKLLKHAWDKYGESSFGFSILEECGVEELTAREQHWIDVYKGAHGNRVANTEAPCGSPMRGQTHTPEAKMKISIANKGLKNPANRQRMLVENPARRPDVRAKLAEKVRVVGVLSVDTGYTWRSIKECSQTLGVSPQAVRHAIDRNSLCQGLILRDFK